MLQETDRLVQPGGTLMDIRTEDLVLEWVPAATHAQYRSTARQLVEQGYLLGSPDRMMNGGQEDATPNAQPFSLDPHGAHKHQRVAYVARDEMMMTDSCCIKAEFVSLLSQGEARPIGVAMARIVDLRQRKRDFHQVGLPLDSCEVGNAANRGASRG